MGCSQEKSAVLHICRKDQTSHKITCLEWNPQNNAVLLLYYLKNYAYNDSKEMNIFFNKIGLRTSKKGRDIDAEKF